MAFQSLAENATRLGQRIQENLKESTRDFPILARNSTATNASLYFDSSDDRLKEISKMLEGGNEQERLEGMKRLIATISKGRNVESFFAQVVKQVASPSIEIRKLVYIYLLRYAASNPDLLLLSINTFQKDLSDPSPLIRSMSLRVLTSIRLPVIQGIVMLGLEKLVNDRNPWVRKSVAGGLAKVYDMDSTSQSILLPILSKLLTSTSPITLGASLSAFEAMCPDNLPFLHLHFRRICRLLVDADEWGQIVALEVLARYARAMLEKPESSGNVSPETAAAIRSEKDKKQKEKSAGKEESQEESPEGSEEDDNDDEIDLDPDIELLLHCAVPLFQSRNYAVVLATIKLFYVLAPIDGGEIGQGIIVSPLLKLADDGARSEVETVAMELCVTIARERPWLLNLHCTRFLVRSTDTVRVKRAKIQILRSLWSPENGDMLIKEFRDYTRSPEPNVVTDAIQAIGFIARKQPELRQQAFGILMKLLRSNRDICVGQAVIVIKSLMQSRESSSSLESSSSPDIIGGPTKLVSRLVRHLPSIRNSSARACIYWLAGQYAPVPDDQAKLAESLGFEGVALWAPDALRLGVKSFSKDAPIVKLQILTMATKIFVLCPHSTPIDLITKYLFQLARYDQDWDVRDRARFLKALIRGIKPLSNLDVEQSNMEEDDEQDTGGVTLRREQVHVVLYGGKKSPTEFENDASIPRSLYEIATLSSVIGKRLANYFPLPEWSDDPSDPSLRDVEDNVPYSSAQSPVTAISSTSVRPPIFTNPRAVSSSMTSSTPTPASGVTPTTKGKFKDLDAFLQSSDEDEDEEDDDDDESSDEETDEDDSEEETDSGGEDVPLRP